MTSKFGLYSVDYEKVHFKRDTPKPTKLKAGLVPGSVLIILSGRFRGKRVVFLKQLESGLLLVTGPYKVNGVPLKRVNQSYTIATSTKVDVSKVDVKAINDEFFAKEKAESKTKEEKFFAADKYERQGVTAARKDAQKKVDASILSALKKEKLMAKYLNARFSLSNGVHPHALKF